MPSNPRPIGDLVHRRPPRTHRPEQGPLQEGRLPALQPVLPQRGPARPTVEEKDTPVPRTVRGLLRTVIAAVNARGMCATQAARIAELPADEVEDIESLCRCRDCALLRAH